MTEITMADFRTIFGMTLLLTVFGWFATSESGLRNLVTTVGGTVVFLIAFFVVFLLFLYLQRQSAW